MPAFAMFILEASFLNGFTADYPAWLNYKEIPPQSSGYTLSYVTLSNVCQGEEF